MKELSVQKIKSRRLIYLACSSFTLLFCGLIMAFSMFVKPIVSTFGLDQASVALTFNIILITNCIGGVGGSLLLGKIGVRNDLILSALLFLIGFAVTGLFGAGNLWVVYVFYGVIGGLGIGIGYNGLIATTNLWFPDRVGFSSGTQLMFFGFGTLIMGTAASNLIPLFGLSAVFIGIGVAAFLCLFLFSLFLKRPPENIVEVMAPQTKNQVKTTDSYDPADEDTPLKSGTFYSYWIWASVMGAIGTTVVGSIVLDSQTLGIDIGIATFLVGFQSMINGLARITVGIIFDKTNTKVTVIVNSIAAFSACSCILLAFVTGITSLYFVGIFCCGFFYGGAPVTTASFIRQRFGMKHYPFNLSLGNFCVVFGSLLNLAIVTIAGPANRELIFVVITALAAIAVVNAFVFFNRMLSRDLKKLDERRAQHEAGIVESPKAAPSSTMPLTQE